MSKHKWHVGVKSNYHCDVFKCHDEPTQKTHGDLFLYCYGGYSTRIKAIQVAVWHNLPIDTSHMSIDANIKKG